MTTTVEIPQTLWDGAWKLAPQEGTTWRPLVEEGLRRIIRYPGLTVRNSLIG
jgi:hypothetical protein